MKFLIPTSFPKNLKSKLGLPVVLPPLKSARTKTNVPCFSLNSWTCFLCIPTESEEEENWQENPRGSRCWRVAPDRGLECGRPPCSQRWNQSRNSWRFGYKVKRPRISCMKKRAKRSFHYCSYFHNSYEQNEIFDSN